MKLTDPIDRLAVVLHEQGRSCPRTAHGPMHPKHLRWAEELDAAGVLLGWDRGIWLHYTTHQVACPVGPWGTGSADVRGQESVCTCGYTALVDKVIAMGMP